MSRIVIICSFSLLTMVTACGDTNRENAMSQEELKVLSKEVMSPDLKAEKSSISDSLKLNDSLIVLEEIAE
ncbi:MAG: hypothetical protein KDC83_03335 [Flavobacteriales bacterium]|nr:hypothetical protein [Flavobacteriales bacterium]